MLGNGITLDGEGESAKLLDRKTGEVLATVEVSTVSKGQRATCAFAAVPGGIAKGAYVLEVTTFGLIGEATPRVFRKPVTLVEAIPVPEPIDQTPDGQAKILKATDGGQSVTFTFGHEWIVETVNMFDGSKGHAGVDWAFGEVMVCTNEGTSGPSAMMLGIYSDDGTRLTINPDSGSIPPGTYANATINIMGLKHGETEPVILHVPINLVVEG